MHKSAEPLECGCLLGTALVVILDSTDPRDNGPEWAPVTNRRYMIKDDYQSGSKIIEFDYRDPA